MRKIILIFVLVAILILGTFVFLKNKENLMNTKNKNQKNMNLIIETIKKGEGERIAQEGDTVTVKYIGKLTDGTIFDASIKHGDQPFSFKIGAGRVIKGWEQGLIGMKIGEKRVLTIPSEMAYGVNGIPGIIPANATLIFEIELFSINN